MLCFRDMTFCGFKECFKFGDCPRSWTEDKQVLADAWWARGGGETGQAPVAMYTDKPKCFSGRYEG